MTVWWRGLVVAWRQYWCRHRSVCRDYENDGQSAPSGTWFTGLAGKRGLAYYGWQCLDCREPFHMPALWLPHHDARKDCTWDQHATRGVKTAGRAD